MPRVKTGVVRRRRHKKILKLAKGFYSGRRKHFRKAKEQINVHTIMRSVTVSKINANSVNYGLFVLMQLVV